jgi:hypothetical protein
LPLLLRIGLVLAAMLVGGVAALMFFPPRATPAETDDEDESARRERLATERNTAASVTFQTALDACRGLPTRLARVAEAAEAKAAALRDGEDAGLTAGPHHVSADWRPPGSSAVTAHDYPSSPGSSWTGAFDQLTAALDDPNANLHTRASAFEQLAKAAREVAKQLENDDGQRELSSELGPLRVLRQSAPATSARSSPDQPARSATNASTSASKSSATNPATTPKARAPSCAALQPKGQEARLTGMAVRGIIQLSRYPVILYVMC